MSKYNGYKNYNHRNVSSLWLNNDEALYRWMCASVRRSSNRELAAQDMIAKLTDAGMSHTPDGVKYTKTAVKAAMVGL